MISRVLPSLASCRVVCCFALCCVVSCRAALCCVVLCCVVLGRVGSCCVVSRCVVFRGLVLGVFSTVLGTILTSFYHIIFVSDFGRIF